jgi:hypothetical protein
MCPLASARSKTQVSPTAFPFAWYAPDLTPLPQRPQKANMICNDRCMSNPENTVGVLAMAGKG